MDLRILTLLLLGLTLPLPGYAHHNALAIIDTSKVVHLEGIVSRYRMINPHARIYFDVAREDGNMEKWMAEGEAAAVLLRRGFTGKELKRDDFIKITGYPGRGGKSIIQWISIILPNGKEMQGGLLLPEETKQNLRNLEERRLAERAEDTSMLAVDSRKINDRPDVSGTWLDPLITFDDKRWPVEDVLCAHTFCSVESYEYLKSLLADRVNDTKPLEELKQQTIEFQTKAFINKLTKAGRKQSIRFDQEGDPGTSCDQPVGFTMQVLSPLPMKIEQYDDKVVFRYEYFNSTRTIHTDGRKHPPDMESSRLGHAVGWYDGNTLVVESRGINPNIYIMVEAEGFIHSEQLVTIERYSRTADDERLNLELTLVDSQSLRYPTTLQYSWLSFPDMELQEFVCDENAEEY